jgi:arylformamidase
VTHGVPHAVTEPAEAGTFVDLSQPIANGMFHSRRYSPPELRQVSSVEEDGVSVTHASFVVHSGTHVDAPTHFFPGGESITEISLDRFVGEGLVVSVARGAREQIPAEDVAPQVEAFGPDAMVCLHTGWDTRYADAEDYRQYPYLSLELAHALVDLKVRMLAIDTPSPDLPEGPRPSGFDWPVHRILMQGGVLITEQVVRLDRVKDRPFRLHALPIALTGSDGAPARVVAEVR